MEPLMAPASASLTDLILNHLEVELSKRTVTVKLLNDDESECNFLGYSPYTLPLPWTRVGDKLVSYRRLFWVFRGYSSHPLTLSGIWKRIIDWIKSPRVAYPCYWAIYDGEQQLTRGPLDIPYLEDLREGDTIAVNQFEITVSLL